MFHAKVNLVSSSIILSTAILLGMSQASAGIIWQCNGANGAKIFTDNPLSCKSNPALQPKPQPNTPAATTTTKTNTTTTTTAPTTTKTTATTTPTAASTPPSTNSTPPQSGFGNYYLKPFAASSPWNSKPVRYTLGNDVIPPDAYDAVISAGAFSTSFYLASATDGPVTIYGVMDADSQTVKDLVLPHWPAGIVPAAGSDGHIDVFDSVTGIIHSFWVAKVSGDRWTARLYAWSKVHESGFGDPAHFYQGARAAAVPTSAGIIRKHEIDDGKDQYSHALAMSLTFSALSPIAPGYIFPATAADDSFAANKGKIPEGALMMLPPDFDLNKISNLAIRKVAKTLMTYGAYVVDRNTGTPFAIYQEIGTKSIAGWQQGADTRMIRVALRQANVEQFVDANGITYTPNLKQNILSMRGNYYLNSGKVKSSFDTYSQKRIWGKTEVKSNELLYIPWPIVSWAKPIPGDMYTVTAKTEGGARFRFQVGSFNSGLMANGESKSFKWPQSYSMVVAIESGIGESSSASGTVIKQ